MKRILFLHNHPQRFVVDDLNILRAHWTVDERYEKSPRQLKPFEIAQAVRNSDLVYGWFASWHTLLPVLLARVYHKPSLMVVGGYDTANVPEANYGSQRGGLRRWIARTVIANATQLLVNSESAKREAIVNAGAISGKIHVAYHGVVPVPSGDLHRRDPLVLTVGNVWQENLLRKGLLPFVQAAGKLPELRFVLAGKWRDDAVALLRAQASSNVEFTGFIPDPELQSLYQQASVYVQPSLHEGFGLSVAEAMSAGCIPVVTSVGSLPEVVGDTGIYARSNAPDDVATAIGQAITLDSSWRVRAQQRVLKEFTMSRREETLRAIVEQLINSAHN